MLAQPCDYTWLLSSNFVRSSFRVFVIIFISLHIIACFVGFFFLFSSLHGFIFMMWCLTQHRFKFPSFPLLHYRPVMNRPEFAIFLIQFRIDNVASLELGFGLVCFCYLIVFNFYFLVAFMIVNSHWWASSKKKKWNYALFCKCKFELYAQWVFHHAILLTWSAGMVLKILSLV